MCWVPKSVWARTWEIRAVQFLGLSPNQPRFSGTRFPSVLTLRAQGLQGRQEPDLQDGKWRQVINRKKLVHGCEADGWVLSPKQGSLWELLSALCFAWREGWQLANKQPDIGLSKEIPRAVKEVKRTWWPIRQGVSRLGDYPDPPEKQLSQLYRMSPTQRFSLPGWEIQFFNTLANYVAD